MVALTLRLLSVMLRSLLPRRLSCRGVPVLRGRIDQSIEGLDVTKCDVLAEVALEDDIEQPLDADTQLLIQSRELHQVNRLP